jgi:hypothetical protein
MWSGRNRFKRCESLGIRVDQIGPTTHDPRLLPRWTASQITAVNACQAWLTASSTKVGFGNPTYTSSSAPPPVQAEHRGIGRQ